MPSVTTQNIAAAAATISPTSHIPRADAATLSQSELANASRVVATQALSQIKSDPERRIQQQSRVEAGFAPQKRPESEEDGPRTENEAAERPDAGETKLHRVA